MRYVDRMALADQMAVASAKALIPLQSTDTVEGGTKGEYLGPLRDMSIKKGEKIKVKLTGSAAGKSIRESKHSSLPPPPPPGALIKPMPVISHPYEAQEDWDDFQGAV